MKKSFAKTEQIITGILYQTIAKRGSSDKINVPILAYHEICDLPIGIKRQHSYNVTPSAFKEQLEYLYKNNYSVITLKDFISCLRMGKEMPYKPVVITFDDGYKNNYTNAFPALKQYNFPATIFLATDYIGTNKPFPWLNGFCKQNTALIENWKPLSWEEVIEMCQDNISFGSHTCSHTNIRLISRNSYKTEIVKSKKLIEQKLNKKLDLFSYPFSFPRYRKHYNPIIKATRDTLIANNFLCACTTIIGTNSIESDPFCLKRIQIKNSDTLFHFKAKIEGAYNWAGFAQKIYQKFLEPVIERRMLH